ncbi:hypothetical protein HYPSUDRAFT_58741 [Hypholoma sublateritium FD-334 SS-4]|uniref:Uncharacterized protein n=1 Tax=Hypholoma sublateritium (strain FD-334 SS-4) TaxID=945553 RepID=A0A0D2NFV6_HYPSF|nr:hypothetical protein HYPSUDRAFT_58741 [Hypholoma sublateritium FD-334 SS-4]
MTLVCYNHNMNFTYGAYLVGIIAATVLYGILVSQTMFYFNRYPKDRLTLKLLVSSLLFKVDILVVYTIICIVQWFFVLRIWESSALVSNWNYGSSSPYQTSRRSDNGRPLLLSASRPFCNQEDKYYDQEVNDLRSKSGRSYNFQPDANSLTWAAIHVSIGKVYSNSVLATLNSRNAIRGAGDDEELSGVQSRSLLPLRFQSRSDGG